MFDADIHKELCHLISSNTSIRTMESKHEVLMVQSHAKMTTNPIAALTLSIDRSRNRSGSGSLVIQIFGLGRTTMVTS